MAGRPRKRPDEKVQYRLIAIDPKDYCRIKLYCMKHNVTIKRVIHVLAKRIPQQI